MPVGKRPAGRQHNFQRARNSRTVVYGHALRSYGIELRKFRMQRRRPLALQTLSHIRPDRGGNRRHSGKPRCQRLEIEAGTADKNRDAALIDGVAERPFGVPTPASDGIVFRCIDVAVQMMWYARLLLGRWTRGYDA